MTIFLISLSEAGLFSVSDHCSATAVVHSIRLNRLRKALQQIGNTSLLQETALQEDTTHAIVRLQADDEASAGQGRARAGKSSFHMAACRLRTFHQGSRCRQRLNAALTMGLKLTPCLTWRRQQTKLINFPPHSGIVCLKETTAALLNSRVTAA